MKSILKKIARISLFALPGIPLIVASPLFFPFITGKNFTFRILVLVGGAAWTILMFRYSEYRPKKSPILWAFVAFAVFLGISDALAINPGKAFWSNFERMEGYITVLYLLLLFIVSSSTFRVSEDWRKFFNISLIAASCTALYSLVQLAGKATINQGGLRIDATLGNATYFAVYMLIHVMIAVFLFLRSRSENKKVFMSLYSVCAIVFSVLLVQTATRGAFLGLIAGLGAAAISVAIFEKKDLFLRKAAIGLVGLGVALILGFFAIKDSDFITQSPIFSRFASISISDATAKSRFMVWGMAWEGVKEKPVFGWGQENFVHVFNKHYDPGMYAQEPWFDRTHNVLFDWAIAGGFLGLLAYLSLFGTSLWAIIKAKELSVAERATLGGLLLGYFVNNLFVFDNIVSYLFFVSIAAYAHTLSGKNIQKIAKVETEVTDMTVTRLVIPISVAAFAICMYFTVYQGLASNLSLISALKYAGGYPTQDIEKAIEGFKKSVSYGILGVSEARERMVESVNLVNASPVDIQVKQKYFDLLKKETAEELIKSKDDARFEFFTSIFYANYGLYDEALLHAEKALAISPTKQTLMYHVGSLLVKLGKVQEGLSVFKKAYDLLPENETAMEYYAVGAIYADDWKLAETLLAKKYGTSLPTDDKFLSAYMDKGRWDLVAAVWDMRIKGNPNDFRYYFQLAVAYTELGMNTKAIEQLKKIKEIEPNVKDQVDQFIKDIEMGKKLPR